MHGTRLVFARSEDRRPDASSNIRVYLTLSTRFSTAIRRRVDRDVCVCRQVVVHLVKRKDMSDTIV